MTDWIQLGRASGTPPADLDRVATALETLERAFRPLVEAMPPSTEPAIILSDSALAE